MFLFFCLDAKEPKNQGFACFATRSLHSAGRIANSRFALKQRCSQPLRSGRSLDAHQPRPILSPASPSASALRITSFLLLFNRIFPFNRIYNPIVLSIRIFNPIISQKELRSFALMQKNQKIKAASASLLAPCTPLFASQTRFAQTAMLPDAPFRSFA